MEAHLNNQAHPAPVTSNVGGRGLCNAGTPVFRANCMSPRMAGQLGIHSDWQHGDGFSYQSLSDPRTHSGISQEVSGTCLGLPERCEGGAAHGSGTACDPRKNPCTCSRV
uniref:Uncharacterized protein n=1 Tax=Eutreptiella gymnastica TaxID=73025 RepID=A0A7S4LCY1_9EUGL